MRLWSVHPKYLDRQGLLAVWREGLLAQKVLAGKTKGYRHHPQLIRFRQNPDALGAIGNYLDAIVQEAQFRNYKFDRTKIIKLGGKKAKIPLARGQLNYEFRHLLNKLRARDRSLYRKLKKMRRIAAHPIFRLSPGKVADWEKTI